MTVDIAELKARNPADDCGIYCIRNTQNDLRYVGQSIKLRMRRWAHFRSLSKKIHCNKKLQHAFNKYGESSFVFEILELCSPECLTEREQYWIDFYGFEKGYNLAPSSESNKGIKLLPRRQEHSRRISVAKKGKPVNPETTRRGIAANVGRKKTPEEIAKLSAAKKGKKRGKLPEAWASKLRAVLDKYRGGPHSEETKRKIARAHLAIGKAGQLCLPLGD